MKKFICILALLQLCVMGYFAPAAMASSYALSLVMDVSGSIDTNEFLLQKQGYADAISNLIPTDGSVAISVIEFGRNNNLSIGWTVIDSVAARDSLVASILALSRSGINTSYTAIGDAITAADSSFGSLVGTWDYCIIDVTTDGSNNYGLSPVTAAQNVVDSGDTDVVNALGIGTSTTPNFAYGTNYDGSAAFAMLTPDFASFNTALEEKFTKEVPVTVPEPTALLFLGLSLAGLAVLKKRQKSI
jgi:hypothetical protein